jgi:hypothetical protein
MQPINHLPAKDVSNYCRRVVSASQGCSTLYIETVKQHRSPI